jgi:hypothetical protein
MIVRSCCFFWRWEWKCIVQKSRMVKTRNRKIRGKGGVAVSTTSKVKNKNAVVVSPKKAKTSKVKNKSAVVVSPEKEKEKNKTIYRDRKVAARKSGSLTVEDPFVDYVQKEVAKKKAEGMTFGGDYRGMLVPMVFEIVAECVSCVLLVPLDPLKTSSNFRAFLQPCYANLFPQWYATVTVKGNNSKSDCEGELMHKVVEMLPTERKVKQVGKGTKYNSYIFAFAVNHSGMEKNVTDEYIVSVARKFGEIVSENLDGNKSDGAKGRIFAADEVYEMKSMRLCQMIRDSDVFRILDDVVSFSDEGNGRMYDFAELVGIPEMKEVLTGAFGEGNLDGKGESYEKMTKSFNVEERQEHYC